MQLDKTVDMLRRWKYFEEKFNKFEFNKTFYRPE